MDLLAGPVGLELLTRMAFGFLAAVAGIALWAHTREPSWILIVAGTLLGYGEVLFRFLDGLGILALDSWIWEGIPVFRVAFAGGVPLLYALGLIGAIRAYRKP